MRSTALIGFDIGTLEQFLCKIDCEPHLRLANGLICFCLDVGSAVSEQSEMIFRLQEGLWNNDYF